MKQDYWICPSILSANLARLYEEVDCVLKAGADRIHFDVMDNHYVPNLTFGPMILSALRQEGINAPMDVHLMVEPVDDLIESFAKAGATSIVFHPETSKHVDRSLNLIKSFGIDAGLVLNPATNPNILDYALEKLDRILVMSVNPGFGGQKFIPQVLDKISNLRNVIDENNLSIRLEVDGGVNQDNIAQIAKAGADTFVAGTAIFGQKDYKVAIDQLRNELI